MLYLLVGDDFLSKNKLLENIKSKYINHTFKNYYIEKKSELDNVVQDSTLFLNTISFFEEIKIVKISCSEELFENSLVDKLLVFSNNENIVILSVDDIKKSILNKYSKNKNITIYNYYNFKSRSELNTFVINTLRDNNIKFKTQNDINLLCDVIATSSKIKQSIFDKQIVQNELDKLIEFKVNVNTPMEYNNIRNLYVDKFDGNFFKLIDAIFIKTSIDDIIYTFEKYSDEFTDDDINSFFNIFRYYIKEYIKFINNKDSKKSYLFIKTKTKIFNPEVLLCELGDIMLDYRIYKRFDLEKINLLIIKHIYFI